MKAFIEWLSDLLKQFFAHVETIDQVDPIEKEIGELKIGLIVGHEKKAQGAVMPAPYRLSEYAYNSEIAQLAKDYAKRIGVTAEIIFRDGIGISGAYKKAKSLGVDCVIELHFNAYNGTVSGTETLCSNEGADKQFANFVHNHVCNVFDRKPGAGDRGVKTLSATDRGGSNVHALPNVPNCLIEGFFGDNPKEAKMALERKEQYAHALIDACVEWANSRMQVNLA